MTEMPVIPAVRPETRTIRRAKLKTMIQNALDMERLSPLTFANGVGFWPQLLLST